jgi:hypothetical protein
VFNPRYGTRDTKANNMNPHNPFGIIQGMGQVNDEPYYSAHGRFDMNQQAWVSDADRFINFNPTAYLQGGYVKRYPGDVGSRGLPPAPEGYNDRQRAHMQEQLAHGGFGATFDWRRHAMSEAEMQAEWARCEAELQAELQEVERARREAALRAFARHH